MAMALANGLRRRAVLDRADRHSEVAIRSGSLQVNRPASSSRAGGRVVIAADQREAFGCIASA